MFIEVDMGYLNSLKLAQGGL